MICVLRQPETCFTIDRQAISFVHALHSLFSRVCVLILFTSRSFFGQIYCSIYHGESRRKVDFSHVTNLIMTGDVWILEFTITSVDCSYWVICQEGRHAKSLQFCLFAQEAQTPVRISSILNASDI